MRHNARPAREAVHSTVNELLRSVIADSLPGVAAPDYSHRRSHDGSWRVHDRKWSGGRIAFARPNLAPVAPSLLGTLQRHGLVVQNDNAAEAIENYTREFEKQLARQIGQQTRAGASRLSGAPHVNNVERLVPPLTWSPTELGEQVFLPLPGRRDERAGRMGRRSGRPADAAVVGTGQYRARRPASPGQQVRCHFQLKCIYHNTNPAPARWFSG